MRRRRRSSSVAALVAAALLVLPIAASVRAGEISPGCRAWNALGVDGWTASVLSVPGPFSTGETLRYRIDDTSIGDVFYLMTTGSEILYSTTHTGVQTYTLTKDVTEIDFNGGGSPPASWDLSHFACYGAGEQPATDTQEKPAAAPADNNVVLGIVALVLLLGSLIVVRPRRR